MKRLNNVACRFPFPAVLLVFSQNFLVLFFGETSDRCLHVDFVLCYSPQAVPHLLRVKKDKVMRQDPKPVAMLPRAAYVRTTHMSIHPFFDFIEIGIGEHGLYIPILSL